MAVRTDHHLAVLTAVVAVFVSGLGFASEAPLADLDGECRRSTEAIRPNSRSILELEDFKRRMCCVRFTR